MKDIIDNFNNILLFGGETKNENMPTGFYSSLAMLSVRGKPIVWWQLNNLKNQNIKNVILVIARNNKKLINYANSVLKETFNITPIIVNSRKNILSSLKHALYAANPNLPTRVILGDSFISKSISEKKDIVFTSTNIVSSDYWCLVKSDSEKRIIKLYDKLENVPLDGKEALVGYYTFSDTAFLLSCCKKARIKLQKEISTVLIAYNKKIPIKTELINDWFDLGHTNGLINAKNAFINARDFNAISIDTKIGVLIKSSKKKQKLKDEKAWYESLPNEIKVLAPRVLGVDETSSTFSLKMELYGYPSLQELYLNSDLNVEDWYSILKKLFDLHSELDKFREKPNLEAAKWLFYTKTIDRIAELKESNEYWKNILSRKSEIINGKLFRGFLDLWPKIHEYITKLILSSTSSIIHGDYCFSNILFDSSNYIFKLIDPRGRLNSGPTIYGDKRYDIAKLRHSFCDFYDFIVQDLFLLQEKDNTYSFKILTSHSREENSRIFNKILKEFGYSISEIKFIEALLFLTMIPLHKDSFKRQQMFYLTSIILFNEVFRDANLY